MTTIIKSFEIISGIAMEMARPKINHGMVTHNLSLVFGNYLRRKKCKVISEPDLHLGEFNFIPDIAVVCNEEYIEEDAIYGPPDLIAEVLSPKTQSIDLGIKKDTYQQYGVREYWIVDPRGKTVMVFLLTDGVYVPYYAEQDIRVSIFPDLTVTLEDIFWKV